MSENVAVISQQPVAIAQPDSLLAAITRAASDPSTDLDKIERLFSLHQKMVAQQAEIAFNTALATAQSEITTVVRNKTNEHTRSKYADLDTIINAISPIYTHHGFSVSFNTEDCQTQNVLRIAATLSHSGGHSRQYRLDAPIDDAGSGGKVNKTKIQATGSTNSYARRYLICMMFNVTTADDNDGNRNTPTTGIAQDLTPRQRKKVQECASMMHEHLRDNNAAEALSLSRGQGFDTEEKIFLWTFFDSKQRALLNKVSKAMPEQAQPATISDAQKRRLEALIAEHKIDRDTVKSYCLREFDASHFAELTPDQYSDLDAHFFGDIQPADEQRKDEIGAVKKVCADAVRIADTNTAWLRLDDARLMIDGMSPENKALAVAEIEAAEAALKERAAK